MTSTSKTKKEIADFLWDWTLTQGDWSKLLVHKIVTNETSLNQNERLEVFNYFLQSLDLYSGLPALSITKPSYKPSEKQIKLVRLSDITGVNKLVKNQSIDFSSNLTVIFGENGTGKTGYCRILKSLGFSYDSNNTILSNIFSAAQPKSAIIKYNSNGKESQFKWDGNNRNSELENISIFNSSCVQISLCDRQLIVTPVGFHLFQLVSTELYELTKLLNNKIVSYPTSVHWKESLNQGTIQNSFISMLSANSDPRELDKIAEFTPTHEKALKDAESELEKLNKTLLQTDIHNLKTYEKELEERLNQIKITQHIFTDIQWQSLISINKQIKTLEAKTQIGIKDIAEKSGISFYNSDEFQNFIKAAEEYIRILNKSDYPNDTDKCIYCLQPINTNAKNLIETYRKILNDKTQQELVELREQKNNLISSIQQINSILTIHFGSFGTDEDNNPVQPPEILEYNRLLTDIKDSFINNRLPDSSTFTFDYEKYINFLSEKIREISKIKEDKNTLVINITAREAALKSQIAEIKDRKLLSTKLTEIKNIVNNYKIIRLLNSKSTSFNTTSISRKTSEARDQLVKSNFEEIFQLELKHLRKSSIIIELGFGTDRGTSKVLARIRSHSLLEVLSEGEQKAISLAEFLTELQLDNTKAPVIFDDPVNSLDHIIIDDVARRLIKLSEDRQVVIFSHSVLLFNSLLYYSKQPSNKHVSFKFYNSKKEYENIGIIIEAEETNKLTDYIKKINQIINNTPKERTESEIAEDGYGYLRSAIELLIENEVFQGTVKRYQKNIALTQFLKVDGSLINQHKEKLNEIFERCCGYIKGHSSPDEVQNSPTLTELKTDFTEFNKIRDSFPK
jgi:energy-coupling factor transporter ATP-binding protein EcfA2